MHRNNTANPMDATYSQKQTSKIVLVCGGREFSNYSLVTEILSKLAIVRIIEGGANGADRLARLFAVENEIPYITYPAQWDKYGKRAGSLRNKQMIDEGKPSLVVAFPGGVGTANMIRQASENNIDIIQVYSDGRCCIV